jgi:hypothetical protein
VEEALRDPEVDGVYRRGRDPDADLTGPGSTTGTSMTSIDSGLTQTLRSLERDRLVTRAVAPTVPVTVTYELTDLGLSLHQLMCDVKAWAEAHMDEVLANRESYDNG